LPNGTTATTQPANDNSTKLATTAYADNISATLGSNKVPYSGATGNVDLNGHSLINNYFADLLDNTKRASLVLSGISTGTARTLTLPDRSLILDNVTTSTTTPLTGLLKGNGTNVSTATVKVDYAPATSGSSILKGDGAGGFSVATGADVPTIAETQVTNLVTDLSNRVLTSTTVNGKALSGNMTLGLASADFANQGSSTTVLHGNVVGNPSFSAVDLSSDITGTLGISNGGTNNAALGVTNGGVIYADGSKLMTSVAGNAGDVLKSNGSAAPTWGYPSLTFFENYLTGNVVLTANTYSGALATITLPAGTWLITSETTVSYASGASTYWNATVVLGTNATTAYTSGEASTRNLGGGGASPVHISLSKIVTLGSTTTISTYAAASVAATVVDTPPNNPSTAGTASGIHAIRIQ
jgi:hypothetical protein